MLPPGLRTPHEVVAYYDKIYFDLLDSGIAHPFIYPWGSLGAFVVLLYLFIDHRQRPWLRRCRFPVFGCLCAFQSWCILTNRARNPASAFGVGLISSWATLWVSAVMVANDCQTDLKRIERSDKVLSDRPAKTRAEQNGTIANGTATVLHANGDLRQRKQSFKSSLPATLSSTYPPANRHGPYFWQAYPEGPFIERLDWVADIFCSFRGVGWSWRTAGVPPPPNSVQAQLDGKIDATAHDEKTFEVSKGGITSFNDRNALLKHTAIRLVIGYLALDTLKTVIMQDPYFFGYTDAPAPAFLPSIMQDSFVLYKTYRLLLSLACIYTALWTIFKLGPMFFCGVLGPKWIGVRGEPWLNPADQFGSYMSVADKGLTGWWGIWWHQTFRLAFEAPAKRILEATGVNKRSAIGKALSLFVAFFLSGCLHASGSYTQLGETRPFRGPMCFFLLQACGIFAQTLLSQQLKRTGIMDRIPKPVKQTAYFVLTHVWLYHTAPLLVDDFAKGGVWLFEPVPISIWRGLGFGHHDDGWWCWWNGIVWWRSGGHFWDTGIAL